MAIKHIESISPLLPKTVRRNVDAKLVMALQLQLANRCAKMKNIPSNVT